MIEDRDYLCEECMANEPVEVQNDFEEILIADDKKCYQCGVELQPCYFGGSFQRRWGYRLKPAEERKQV